MAESALRGGLGAAMDPDLNGGRADAALFAETQSRVLISAAPSRWADLEQRARAAEVPVTRLGTVGGDRLQIGPVDVALGQASAAWENGLSVALAGDRPSG